MNSSPEIAGLETSGVSAAADFQQFAVEARKLMDAALDRVLPAESIPPERVHAAIRWSVFAGGKRFRPILLLAVGETFGADTTSLLDTACALEMIHTYSLIHDDLPAMDDDDFRRGLPSCHKKFGEALAILAGDALLTLVTQGSLQAAIFRSDDLDATFEKVRASGAEVLQEPVSQPWGARDCAFRDPSGNMVRISQGPTA